MNVISHQTVRLSAGRHFSPEHGMCVMELASVLAGERFTDHPASVSPVIAALLRAYNDRVDDERRQRLIPLAAEVVGTRSDAEVESARVQLCREWAERHTAALPWWRRGPRRWAKRALAASSASHCGDAAARLACAGDEALQDSVLALVDELVALGRHTPDPVPPRRPAERTAEPVA